MIRAIKVNSGHFEASRALKGNFPALSCEKKCGTLNYTTKSKILVEFVKAFGDVSAFVIFLLLGI